MKIIRKETWGEISYDTSDHAFGYHVRKNIDEQPYVSQPVLLNLDLTFRCNLLCVHCVARDMEKILGGRETADLNVSTNLIQQIDKSPYMVIVITGGEPLLPEYESSLAKLIKGIKNKGVIVDTNGTITPSSKLLELFRKKKVMLRISWDSPNPIEEYSLRIYPKGMYMNHEDYLEKKIHFIKSLNEKGLIVSIQTVLHSKNYDSENLRVKMPLKLKEMQIGRWYLQRYIPTGYNRDKQYKLSSDKYEEGARNIIKKAKELGIACYTKRDRRHNSVFLLVKDGDIYTQSDNEDKPGEKVFLGKIGKMNKYFEFVSSSEHTVRYVDYI